MSVTARRNTLPLSEGNTHRVLVAKSELRWLRRVGTTMEPDRLQQAWQDTYSGAYKWHDVPVVVEGSVDD